MGEDYLGSSFTVSSTLDFNQNVFCKELLSDMQSNEFVSAVYRPMHKRKTPTAQDVSHPISANHSLPESQISLCKNFIINFAWITEFLTLFFYLTKQY